MKKKIVLITQHVYNSKRKAGFHWLADEYNKKGYEVLFLTIPLSYVHALKGDYRYKLAESVEPNSICHVNDNVYQYINKTIFHVPSFRNHKLDYLTYPLIIIYEKLLEKTNLNTYFKDVDMFVFESGLALLAFPWIKRKFSDARYVYRVSDDVKLLNPHIALLKTEANIVSQFDLVSAPCAYIKHELEKRSKNKLTVQVDFHGVNKNALQTDELTPYKPGSRNAVFVGNARFDYDFLDAASCQYPSINFHVIGPVQPKLNKNNVTFYGEMPYLSTIRYIKYADFGLSNLCYSHGAESFTDSLKILQYCYFKKPIVVPDFLKTDRKNTFCYTPGQSGSIKQAIDQALEFDGSGFECEVPDWSDLAEKLL